MNVRNLLSILFYKAQWSSRPEETLITSHARAESHSPFLIAIGFLCNFCMQDHDSLVTSLLQVIPHRFSARKNEEREEERERCSFRGQQMKRWDDNGYVETDSERTSRVAVGTVPWWECKETHMHTYTHNDLQKASEPTRPASRKAMFSPCWVHLRCGGGWTVNDRLRGTVRKGKAEKSRKGGDGEGLMGVEKEGKKRKHQSWKNKNRTELTSKDSSSRVKMLQGPRSNYFCQLRQTLLTPPPSPFTQTSPKSF